MNSVFCNSNTATSIQNNISYVLDFLHHYSVLIDSFVLDFFVDDLWLKLPQNWQLVLEEISPQSLSQFLTPNTSFRTNTVCPLSLLAFREVVFSMNIPSRQVIESPEPIYHYLNRNFCQTSFQNESNLVVGSWWGSANSELTEAAGQHKGIHHVLRRKVKPKKQHEIVRLTQVVRITLDALKCQHIVDIGCGQGHLSRMLAMYGNFAITSFDAEDGHISKAQLLDDKAFSIMKKQTGDNTWESSTIQRVTKFIPSCTNEDTFTEMLRNATKSSDNSFDSTQFALVGLHTCGDLAATIIRAFAACPNASALFSVGCCYMKMGKESYPLSSSVKKMSNCHLSYYAREAACHAIENYREKLKGDISSLKIHCYRATLETIILKYYPNKKHLGLKGVKNGHNMPFADYARIALQSTRLSMPDDELISESVAECLIKWKRVVAFYSLRLLLATLVETVILLDRTLFLQENNIESCLLPIFDPKVSPRNYILVAAKET